MKRIGLPMLVALLLCPLIPGCAAAPDDPPRNPDAPPIAGPGAGPESPALGLVNLWRVVGAEGEDADTWLRLDAQEFQLWRDCGMINGSWEASEGLFVGAVWGSSGECATGSRPTVPWLEAVTGYAATADGYQFVDAKGTVLATLTIDGAPEPIPTAAESFAQPPEITAKVKEVFRSPSPLAAGLEPATADTLLGRWVPVAYAVKTDPHVRFAADGSWKGSDGCNGGEGRWTVGAGGVFLATTGPSTLIACAGAPVPTWVGQAASAGFDQGWLLLFDLDGNEMARLQRG